MRPGAAAAAAAALFARAMEEAVGKTLTTSIGIWPGETETMVVEGTDTTSGGAGAGRRTTTAACRPRQPAVRGWIRGRRLPPHMIAGGFSSGNRWHLLHGSR